MGYKPGTPELAAHIRDMVELSQRAKTPSVPQCATELGQYMAGEISLDQLAEHLMPSTASVGPGTVVETPEGFQATMDAPLAKVIPIRRDLREHRVRLTREEFQAVADGQYPHGRTPENGPPTG
jgi:hypothetical protein